MPRHPTQIDRARQLRRQMTPAEGILWRHLRSRRFAGYKFRRQHPIGQFFADFSCHAIKLIVELDGESHLGAEHKDEARSQYLINHGWRGVRFWNPQVYDELDMVLETIHDTCVEGKTGDSPPHPQPLSPEAGARGEA